MSIVNSNHNINIRNKEINNKDINNNYYVIDTIMVLFITALGEIFYYMLYILVIKYLYIKYCNVFSYDKS